jgi:hypothetical protein
VSPSRVRQGREPDVLRIGRVFGAVVAAEYPANVRDARAEPERYVQRGSGRARWLPNGIRAEPSDARLGRSGRVDLLLELLDEASGLPFLVLLEVKATDWDRQAERRVRPNLARHARQVWSYLEPLTEHLDRGELAWLQAALVYPRKPKSRGRAEYIEDELGQHGITVLWYDELDEPTS